MLHQKPLAQLQTVATEPQATTEPAPPIPDGNVWELATFALVAPGSMVVAVATTFLVMWGAQGHRVAAAFVAVSLYTLFLGALAGVRVAATARAH
jgi:hypothetical protein